MTCVRLMTFLQISLFDGNIVEEKLSPSTDEESLQDVLIMSRSVQTHKQIITPVYTCTIVCTFDILYKVLSFLYFLIQTFLYHRGVNS